MHIYNDSKKKHITVPPLKISDIVYLSDTDKKEDREFEFFYSRNASFDAARLKLILKPLELTVKTNQIYVFRPPTMFHPKYKITSKSIEEYPIYILKNETENRITILYCSGDPDSWHSHEILPGCSEKVGPLQDFAIFYDRICLGSKMGIMGKTGHIEKKLDPSNKYIIKKNDQGSIYFDIKGITIEDILTNLFPSEDADTKEKKEAKE